MNKYVSSEIPCNVGQTVYKICPKCNPYHSGNCENCAWRGCFMTGCDIGIRVYSDGSHCEHPLQIIPYRATPHRFMTVLLWWNIMYFATEEEAQTALAEYESIRKISDRKERYKAYKKWESHRETKYTFWEDKE